MTGISEHQLLKWVNHVDLMRIPGVGSEYSDLLEAAGRRLARRARAAQRGEPRPDLPGAGRGAPELDPPGPVAGDGRGVDRGREGPRGRVAH